MMEAKAKMKQSWERILLFRIIGEDIHEIVIDIRQIEIWWSGIQWT